MSTTKNMFQWDKSKYTTLVDQMDAEHERLIAIMNRLSEENSKGAPKTQLLRIIDELGKYTKDHFTREEAYFEKIPNYKSVASHKLIHSNLLKEFGGHAEKYKNGGDRVPDEFFLFLKVWLQAHICGVDRKYGELVTGKTV